ncbi:MAG: hypothetical protein IJ761_00990 [Bacteroidales bacterium]|nr:hypothetical protein [Bacteroidales bacterium]
MEKNNQQLFDTLRTEWPVLQYASYRHYVSDRGLEFEFEFRLSDDVVFRPHSWIEQRPFLNFNQPVETLNILAFNIGMIELISYWKCVCPKQIDVLCGALSESDVAFWKKLYWNGLGEFFYTNGINTDIEHFTSIHAGTNSLSSPDQVLINTCQYLVPVGGGKDSVVTWELLKRAGYTVRPLIMNPRGATIGCVEAGGVTINDAVIIHRSIDPLLLEMNAKGCLNGHTPFSAMLAFYALVASVASGMGSIALSNENSANESTVLGTSVNHQYSKGIEFEADFGRYVRESMHLGCRYFSFLRPLSELQIAMIFSRLEAYHDVFRSCNVGSKTDSWCGNCAKCLFAYIILSPFIEPRKLNAIFGKSMLDDIRLAPIFEQLVGHAATKPFECVGTVDEVNTALAMAIDRWYATDRPALLVDYRPTASVDLAHLCNEHFLNNEEISILQQCIASIS